MIPVETSSSFVVKGDAINAKQATNAQSDGSFARLMSEAHSESESGESVVEDALISAAEGPLPAADELNIDISIRPVTEASDPDQPVESTPNAQIDSQVDPEITQVFKEVEPTDVSLSEAHEGDFAVTREVPVVPVVAAGAGSAQAIAANAKEANDLSKLAAASTRTSHFASLENGKDQVIARSIEAPVVTENIVPKPIVAGAIAAPETQSIRDRRFEFARSDPEARTGLVVAQDGRTASALVDMRPTQPVAVPPPLTAFADLNTQLQQLGNQDWVGPTQTSSTSGSQSVATATHIQQTQAPQVAAQIATALVQTNGGTTEIRLSPEELGRVRIALTSSETGLVVSIQAERPETADLLKRNLDALAREFSELGYDSLDFEFDGQQQDTSNDDETGAAAPSTGEVKVDPKSIALELPLSAAVGGLDLKL